MSLIHEAETAAAAERLDLIARYIVPDPHHPGIAHSCLCESAVSAWALVAYYETVGYDLHRVASDYDIPAEQIRAALAFYCDHSESVDAYLTSRIKAVSDG